VLVPLALHNNCSKLSLCCVLAASWQQLQRLGRQARRQQHSARPHYKAVGRAWHSLQVLPQRARRRTHAARARPQQRRARAQASESMSAERISVTMLLGCASRSLNTLSSTLSSVAVVSRPQKAAQSFTTMPAPTTSLPRFTVPATRGTCAQGSGACELEVRGMDGMVCRDACTLDA
jgi:hypothetical protein